MIKFRREAVVTAVVMTGLVGCGGRVVNEQSAGGSGGHGGSSKPAGGSGGSPQDAGGTGGSTPAGGSGGWSGCQFVTEPQLLGVSSDFIAVDDSFVYTADGWYGGTVRRIPLCGGEATELASGQDRPFGIAVNDTDVFWAEQGDFGANGAIWRWHKSTGQLTTIASGQLNPSAVVIDEHAIYWQGNFIFKAPLSGGAATQLGSKAGSFMGLAQDATHIYFAGINTVGRVPKSGGDSEMLVQSEDDDGWSAAVDHDWVYYTIYGGSLKKVAKTGGEPIVLTGPGPQRCLDIDETHVYYTQDGKGTWSPPGSTEGTLLRVPKAGGTLERLAAQSGESGGVKVTATDVYWTNGGGYGEAGNLYRLSK